MGTVVQSLSGTRVHSARHAVLTSFLPALTDRGPMGVCGTCYNPVVGVETRDEWRILSKNSALPIKRETCVLSRLSIHGTAGRSRRNAVRYFGTQGNHGSDSPLAGGVTLRAIQSRLSLSRWRESLTVKLQSLQNTDRPMMPKIEIIRRSEVRGSASVTQNRQSRIPGSRVPCVFAQAFTTCVNAGK